MKLILLTITTIVALGLIGSSDAKMERAQLISDMQNTCARSYQVIDRQLENACGDYIDRVQANGSEVILKDGEFTVEEK